MGERVVRRTITVNADLAILENYYRSKVPNNLAEVAKRFSAIIRNFDIKHQKSQMDIRIRLNICWKRMKNTGYTSRRIKRKTLTFNSFTCSPIETTVGYHGFCNIIMPEYSTSGFQSFQPIYSMPGVEPRFPAYSKVLSTLYRSMTSYYTVYP